MSPLHLLFSRLKRPSSVSLSLNKCCPAPSNLIFLFWTYSSMSIFWSYFWAELQMDTALCWCALVSCSVGWKKLVTLHPLKVKSHSLGSFKVWVRTGLGCLRSRMPSSSFGSFGTSSSSFTLCLPFVFTEILCNDVCFNVHSAVSLWGVWVQL